ncbi:Immunoglobulin I-set domain protein [Pedosphaera parvula Ellin514]|uniref:Immunoglobulin I-set domain protein n=2 Tax=Pedosphaera TaxID=1032526 RepID=B9XES7_PEDPL|nr:Immunoglobulin I-set domain protein [Pedosphaera parvula Ellin514]
MMALAATAQTGSVVAVDANQVLMINGRKVFAIGFSPGPPTYGKTSSGNDALQELRDAGAVLFRITQTNNWDSQVISDQQAALDWAAQHGMYCWVNLRELSRFSATDTNTPASLRNVVDTFRNHPALGLWKNFDESWWAGVSEADLQRGYEVTKQEDANHPVVQTHAPRGTVPDLQPYNAAADILALDIYPVSIPPGAHSLLPNKEISMVGDWTEFLSLVAAGGKEYWMIEQIAWSGVTPPSKTLIFPTYTQERFMAYQAIINGARGLVYFGGNIAATLNTQDAPLGWNWTFWNDVLKPVVQQLGDHNVLAQALVATNSTLPITMSGTTAPDVEYCVREVPPYLYILASKREGTVTNVTFSGLPSWALKGEVLYESPRVVAAQNGQFEDVFAPFDVHVYRFSQTNQPPTILFQPQSRTNSVGTTASFSVTADGTGPLTYQWRKNGFNLTDGGNVFGAGLPSLMVTNISLSDAAGYDVVVTGFGSVTSAPTATLSVLASQSPTINGQPQSRANYAGTTVSFSVTADGTSPLVYQWRKDGSNIVDGGVISGASAPTLTLTGISSVDAGSYSVVVSNVAGSVLSIPATLTVIYPLPFYEPFDYAAGLDLGGQIGGNYLGWSDIGTGTVGPFIIVQTNSLMVPGLMPAAGNSIRFGGLGKSVRLSMPAGMPVTSGTLYYSFALQVLDTNGLSSAGTFLAGFNNSIGAQANQPTVVGTRLYMRATNDGFNLGVSKNSSVASDWVWDPRTFTTNQVLFIVGSYTFNPATTSDDISKLWINPGEADLAATAEPAAMLVATNGSDITANQIASFVFLQRATTEPAAMVADELRIGRTWAEVTPLPPPIMVLLTGMKKLSNGAFQFAYSNSNSSGQSGSTYVSTNLTDWTPLGTATQISAGRFEFTDPAATNYLRRFYQLRTP